MRLNWDPNEAASFPDHVYTSRWHLSPPLHDLFGYLDDLSPDQVKNYWLVTCGRWKCRRGEYEKGLSDFREAVRKNSEDFAAINELAWLLATCPDDKIRSGREAVMLAEKLVSKARCASWLDTLAAGYAESGDFEKAISTEKEAATAAKTPEGALSANESVAGFEACLATYRQRKTYVESVKSRAFVPPVPPAAINDEYPGQP